MRLSSRSLSLPGRVTAGLFSFYLLISAVPALAATPTVTSAKITDPNTITITFSEPVYSQTSDYSAMIGNLSGRGIQTLAGNGTNLINLTIDGGYLPPNASGSFTLASTTKSVTDSLGYNGSTVSVTDGQAPVLTSLSFTADTLKNTFAKYGSSATLTFSANEPITTPNVSVAGTPQSVNGANVGPYTSNFSLPGGQTEGTVPVSLIFYDNAGNQNSLSFTLTPGTSVSAPVISSITSTANSSGVLKVGDYITFTLTPSAAQPGATVSGSYNGTSLSWSTSNSGTTYTATYTIAAGHNDQSTPLQISGVALTSSAGRASAAFSGTDVQKTISANVPVLTEIVPIIPVVNDATPEYMFSSTKAGTISYQGDCSGPTTSASAGLNTISFSALSNTLHDNCTLLVTDAGGNASNRLAVRPFTVMAMAEASPAPAPAETPTSASESSFKFTKQLKIGSKGKEVTELQKQLTAMILYNGPVNGNFGPMTSAAVKRLQSQYQLPKVGQLGPATRAILNKLLGK